MLNGNLNVWDIARNQAIFSTNNIYDSNGNLAAFTWLPDSHSILTVDNNNTQARWSVG
jgi:hypothetical protein